MIRLEQLHIGYHQKSLAVLEADVTLQPGTFTALIGTNGAGKSTLLRAVATGAHILKGNVYYHEQDFKKLSIKQRASLIAIVLTSNSVNPALTVWELLSISRAPHTSFMGKLTTTDLELIEETVTVFDCSELLNKRLHTLSDGQLQRVLVARAMVQETPYICMDEPSSHLDINYKANLLNTLKKQCIEKNKCIIYASHELEIAIALSTQILTIHQEKITLHDTETFIKNNVLETMFPSPLISFKEGKTNYHF